MSYVFKKTLKELIRTGVIELAHVSDDGEFIRYKILPDGPEVGEWHNFGQKLMVVDCKTVHENFLKSFPQLFKQTPPDTEKGE